MPQTWLSSAIFFERPFDLRMSGLNTNIPDLFLSLQKGNLDFKTFGD